MQQTLTAAGPVLMPVESPVEMREGRPLERLFMILIPLWLFGLIFPPAFLMENRIAQVIAFMWPIPLFLLRSRGRFIYSGIHRGSLAARILTAAFVVEILISSILSVDPLLSLGYSATATVGLVSCAGLWSCINWRMERALGIYAVLGSMFAIYAVVNGDSIQGRLTFGHPNYLGLICFGVLVCSLAIPNLLAVRAALVAINLYVIMEAQARACLVASAISILVYILVATRRSWLRRSLGIFTTISALLGLLSIYLAFRDEVSNKISTLLFLDDQYRGVGTGFTGRVDAWQEAFNLFRENPFFGVGFRMHEQFMTTLSSAHNGYLSTLAETGVFGLLCSLALIAVCGRRLFNMALTGDRAAIVGSAFVSGFLFIALFDRYLVNFGSSTPVLMWIFLFMPKWQRPGSCSQSA